MRFLYPFLHNFHSFVVDQYSTTALILSPLLQDGDEEMYWVDETIIWNNEQRHFRQKVQLFQSEFGARRAAHVAPWQQSTLRRKQTVSGLRPRSEPLLLHQRRPAVRFQIERAGRYESHWFMIDVGDKSNVTKGSALWIIDDKYVWHSTACVSLREWCRVTNNTPAFDFGTFGTRASYIFVCIFVVCSSYYYKSSPGEEQKTFC